MTVNNIAPSNLSYNINSDVIYSVNTPINPPIATATGDDLVYSVSPDLPSGLSLNVNNGTISGTPNLASKFTTYTITVTNSGGSTTAILNIAVNNDVAPIVLPSAAGEGSTNFSIPMNATQNIGSVSDNGINILAYVNSQANFKLSEGNSSWQTSDHSLKINSLDLYKNTITITIASVPQTLTLKEGENRELDLDGDGKNDVLVSFVDIYVNRAEITVKSLSQEITQTKSSSTPVLVPTAPVKTKTFIFKKDLKLNVASLDVKELQKYLNASGFTVAKSGAGSKGKETTKFGSATKAALIKFQKAKKISPANGIFGTSTRKVINGK